LNHLFNLLLKGEEEVAQSTFPRTMLEMTLIRMATLRPVLPIEDILKRLEGLEKSLPTPLVETAIRKEAFHGNRKEIRKAEPSREAQPSGEAEPLREAKEKEVSALLKKAQNSDDPQKSDDLVEEEPVEKDPTVREEAWKDLVGFTRTKNPVLGAFLSLGDLIHISDDRVEIGFEKDSFHYERMLEVENRSQLEVICREYLKKNAKLVITPVGQRVKSRGRVVSEIAERGQTGQEKQVETGKSENPLIQEALSLFNGKIVEG
jgi:DNA polymerase-3 subunit gamma/tau